MKTLQRSSALLLAAVVLVLGVIGCGRSTELRRSYEPPATAPSASSSAETTATGDDEAAPKASEQGVVSEPIDAAEAEALERELRAIEKELDTLDLPSDGDFAGIEGSLE